MSTPQNIIKGKRGPVGQKGPIGLTGPTGPTGPACNTFGTFASSINETLTDQETFTLNTVVVSSPNAEPWFASGPNGLFIPTTGTYSYSYEIIGKHAQPVNIEGVTWSFGLLRNEDLVSGSVTSSFNKYSADVIDILDIPTNHYHKSGIVYCTTGDTLGLQYRNTTGVDAFYSLQFSIPGYFETSYSAQLTICLINDTILEF